MERSCDKIVRSNASLLVLVIRPFCNSDRSSIFLDSLLNLFI